MSFFTWLKQSFTGLPAGFTATTVPTLIVISDHVDSMYEWAFNQHVPVVDVDSIYEAGKRLGASEHEQYLSQAVGQYGQGLLVTSGLSVNGRRLALYLVNALFLAGHETVILIDNEIPCEDLYMLREHLCADRLIEYGPVRCVYERIDGEWDLTDQSVIVPERSID